MRVTEVHDNAVKQLFSFFIRHKENTAVDYQKAYRNASVIKIYGSKETKSAGKKESRSKTQDSEENRKEGGKAQATLRKHGVLSQDLASCFMSEAK